MAKEYIEREAFVNCEKSIYCEDCDRRKNSNGKLVYAIGDAPCRACNIRDVLNDAEDFPTDDVVERKREHIIEDVGERSICSGCGIELLSMYFDGAMLVTRPNYCPNCGAKMDGGQDDG